MWRYSRAPPIKHLAERFANESEPSAAVCFRSVSQRYKCIEPIKMLNDCIDFARAVCVCFFPFSLSSPPACVPQAESLIYCCTEASGFYKPQCRERKGIRALQRARGYFPALLIKYPIIACGAKALPALWKKQKHLFASRPSGQEVPHLFRFLAETFGVWKSSSGRRWKQRIPASGAWWLQLPSGLWPSAPTCVFVRSRRCEPRMRGSNLFYGADCHCDFCHSRRVNYEAGSERISHSRGRWESDDG